MEGNLYDLWGERRVDWSSLETSTADIGPLEAADYGEQVDDAVQDAEDVYAQDYHEYVNEDEALENEYYEDDDISVADTDGDEFFEDDD